MRCDSKLIELQLKVHLESQTLKHISTVETIRGRHGKQT
jgi:hypothetical protein